MQTYRQLRRTRKLKKIGEKVGIIIIFLVISYVVSLISFFLYKNLSQILQPVEKGFLGFAIIGLIAGIFAVLISLVNKRLQLTVVISFFVDCLVESVLLFSDLGIRVVSFLPGLLVGMLAIVGSGYLLKRKFGFLNINILSPRCLKDKDYKKYALARKLLENPNKITMEVLIEACGVLQDPDLKTDPRIKAVLKEVDNFTRALSGDVLGFIVANIKTEKEKDEEKKEKVLFFIDLINDIKEEIDVAFARLGPGEVKNFVDHPIKQANHSFLASGTTTANNPSIVVTIVTGAVIATSISGIIPGISPLTQNMTPPPETKDSQEIIVPTPTAIPTILPTVTPKIVQFLTYSAVEKTIFVSAVDEGITYTAGSTGTYRFTITSGAVQATQPGKGPPGNTGAGKWNSRIIIYKNRPIDFSGHPVGFGTIPVNPDYVIGSIDFVPTFTEAENIGKGSNADIYLQKGDYVILSVWDSTGDFGDNLGGMYVQVQKANVSTQIIP